MEAGGWASNPLDLDSEAASGFGGDRCVQQGSFFASGWPLHILINDAGHHGNATGVAMLGGYESQFSANHLGGATLIVLTGHLEAVPEPKSAAEVWYAVASGIRNL